MNLKHLDYLSALLENEVKERRVYGCAVTIGHGGKQVFTSEHGDIKEDTYVMLCSMTKPVTSVAAWILVERGIIDHMDDVSKYLPGYKNPQVYMNGMLEPAKREIRISDLFNMTSGVLYGMEPMPQPGTLSHRMQEITRDMRRRIDDGEGLTNVDIIDALGQVPLIFHPGDQWNYGKSADLLAAVVEVASGMTFGEFLKKEILDPLEMNDTGFVIKEEDMNRVARIGFAGEENGKQLKEIGAQAFYGDSRAPYEQPYIENGGGGMTPIMGRGLYSTLRDYAKFADMLLHRGTLNGARILSGKTVALFSENMLTEEQQRTLPPWSPGYGYSNLMKMVSSREKSFSAASNGEFGCDGALGTHFFVSPADDLYVVYMQQSVSPTMMNRRIDNIVFGAL